MMKFEPQPEVDSEPSKDTTTFYIAGPMKGRPYFNFPAFDAARDELQRKGFQVISPADLDRQVGIDPMQFDRNHDWTANALAGQDLQAAIERDIEAIQKCDAIYMLEGWENSAGAKAEKAIAEWNGMEVFFQTAECEPIGADECPMPTPAEAAQWVGGFCSAIAFGHFVLWSKTGVVPALAMAGVAALGAIAFWWMARDWRIKNKLT